jgi:hypothetical protein
MKFVLDVEPQFSEIFSKMDKYTHVESPYPDTHKKAGVVL